MRKLLYLIALGLFANGCKPPMDTNLTPVGGTSATFTIAPDSIKLNPYGYTPLSALVNFSVSTPGKTFIRVRGKHGGLTNVEHLFNDMGTYHTIPVIGLYANYANIVDIRLVSASGDTLAQSTITIQTGALPPNMPVSITPVPFDESRVAPGLILVSNFSTIYTGSPLTPYFMDAYGDIRWVLDYRSNGILNALDYDDGIARLRNGNFFFGDITTSAIYEVDLLGKIVNQWALPGYTFNHNVIEKPDNNLIVTVTKAGSTKLNGTSTIEDYVIELDRKTGNVVTEWDLKQSLDENRTALAQSPRVTVNDWFHANSVVYDSTDNTIVVSGRHQGVVKLDYQNRVKWILAPHRGWTVNRRGENLSQFLLTPLDAQGLAITDTAVVNGSKLTADFEWNWYQHSNITLPNGDIMVFDNGEIREFDPTASNYSRAVQYRIDPVKMTVQQVWTYGKERGLAAYSQIIGSVQLLTATNHVVFAPGYQVQNDNGLGGKVIEIDPVTNTVVSELSVNSANGWGFHRAKKMSAYPATLPLIQ